MDKQEPVRWITINGKHIPIFDDDYADDVPDNIDLDDYEKQYKSYPSYSNGDISDKYINIKDKDKMVEQFEKDMGISVDRECSDACDRESLAVVFDTLYTLQEEGYDVSFTEITSMDKSKKIASTTPNGSVLKLNTVDYYNKKLSELEKLREQGVKAGIWIPGPFSNNAKHEVGHRLFARKILVEQEKSLGVCNMDDPDSVKLHTDTFKASKDYLKTGNINTALYGKNKAYTKLVDRFKRVEMAISSISTVKDLSIEEYAKFYMSNKAGQNLHESVAESFADIDTNGSKASFMSNILYTMMLKEDWD